MNDKKKVAIIIGAGPAGLSAAYELLETTDIQPIVLEMSDMVGGISKTICHHGNRMDLGGHRFFSKSDVVMKFWEKIMREYRKQDEDSRFLIRSRLSRILYLRRFFSYPITLSFETLRNLGLVRTVKIGTSYVKTCLMPKKPAVTLEDFFIQRFGKELYLTFFKDYTEKVWGVPCNQISADWGAQRIKELSILKTILHALKKPFLSGKDVEQKNVDTSLIERFIYPKYGPGQFWENLNHLVRQKGAQVVMDAKVTEIHTDVQRITKVVTKNANGETQEYIGDYFISSMPVQELITAFKSPVPVQVQRVSEGLQYRDFITVGLLVDGLKLKDPKNKKQRIKDNWIYIQENDVHIGRLQIFNNWSPFMVKDKKQVFMGLEYFCNEGDFLWEQSDEAFIEMAIEELVQLGIVDRSAVVDAVRVRVPKAYPAYFGTYKQFDVISNYTDGFTNLFLVGRNGQHRYNNMDHSILTAFEAVKNIRESNTSKANVWAVNAEKEYHEKKENGNA